jgi:hypothetical protein
MPTARKFIIEKKQGTRNFSSGEARSNAYACKQDAPHR